MSLAVSRLYLKLYACLMFLTCSSPTLVTATDIQNLKFAKNWCRPCLFWCGLHPSSLAWMAVGFKGLRPCLAFRTEGLKFATRIIAYFVHCFTLIGFKYYRIYTCSCLWFSSHVRMYESFLLATMMMVMMMMVIVVLIIITSDVKLEISLESLCCPRWRILPCPLHAYRILGFLQ
jgi:hypothetical protein